MSVRLWHPFITFLPLYHHDISRSYCHWQEWCPCKRPRWEVNGPDHRGQNSIYPFPDGNSSLKSHMRIKWGTQLDVTKEMCPVVFQGYLSNFKVIRLMKSSTLTRIRRFQTLTEVWIHQRLRNDTQSLKKHRRGVLLFYKIIRQISRSHGTKITDFDLNWEFQDCNSSFNAPIALKWRTKLDVVWKMCSIVFQGHHSYFLCHTGQNLPILRQIENFWIETQVEFTNGFDIMHKT